MIDFNIGRMMYNQYVLPSIINYDELFSKTPNTIVFNDIMLEHSVTEVVDILCDISSDQTDSVCSCECEALKGNYYNGTTCRVCGTVCKSSLFGEIRNDSWVAVPNSIKGVLNPQVFRILDHWMGNSGNKQSILKMMLDMQMPVELIPNTPFYSGAGFNWFYDNFDTIINFFLYNHPSKTGKKLSNKIDAFLKQTGKAIWCRYLPILSKFIQPITKVNRDVRYADTDIKNLMKAVFTLRSILLAEKTMRFSKDHVDRNFFKVYIEFINYTRNILYLKLPKKPSILRKHVFGSRSHCSARSVAIPITDPHDSDEIYLPWKIGVTMYRYHIMSLLQKLYRIPQLAAYNRIMNAVNMYDHEIDLIMQQLIRDCPFKGLPILVNRNPSLRIASIQLFYVTKIKPALLQNPVVMKENSIINIEDDDSISSSSYILIDNVSDEIDDPVKKYLQSCVEDATIAVSPLIVKGPNLDLTSCYDMTRSVRK